MRLWSIHPKYLDTKGLVALWREALLAQAVLQGQTKGYQHHPQLMRFKATHAPVATVAVYLQSIWTEAHQRGYHFDAAKISPVMRVDRLVVTQGQLAYEWQHLQHKLQNRAPAWLMRWGLIVLPEPHPLFDSRPGSIENWEIIR